MADGLITTVFASAADYASGQIHVSVETLPYTGNLVTYTVSEVPFSGNPSDRILDPPLGTTGTVLAGSAIIQLPLAARPPNQPLPPGSLLAIDSVTVAAPYQAAECRSRVAAGLRAERCRADPPRQDQQADSRIAVVLNFNLPVEGRVTIRVDGSVLTHDASGASIPPFADIALPAGWNRIAIGRQQVPEPGTHSFLITATFEQNVTAVAAGTILHDVQITESLPIGHTFIKGVDLQDGHLSLSRDDVAIGSVGPGLSFSRSYSSSGVRSSGPMGAGWSHNWQSSISVDAFGTINVSAGDGGGGRFSTMAGGPGTPGVTRFKADPGYHGFVEFSNGAYDFYSKARFRYHFEKPASDPNSDYLLQWVEDSNANRLTLTYHNGTQLERVTDAVGRSLTFTYGDHGVSPEPRIERVEGPLGLVVEFAYDEFGNLKSAAHAMCDPNSTNRLRHPPDRPAQPAARDGSQRLHHRVHLLRSIRPVPGRDGAAVQPGHRRPRDPAEGTNWSRS